MHPGPAGASNHNFKVTVDFLGGLSPTQQAAFTSAANRWAQIITGDIPDLFNVGFFVDDVRISASGVPIDAYLTRQLLINIFYPNSPLHDAAVVVRGDRIVAASVVLPLTDNISATGQLGTRHRAAIGITEQSDALGVVVSEETGHDENTYNVIDVTLAAGVPAPSAAATRTRMPEPAKLISITSTG